MDPKDIHPGMMKAHIGSAFQVMDVPGEPLLLTLAEVEEKSSMERTESFSLFFQGPVEPYLPQGMRKLQQETLGEMELFLVPVGKNARGYQYEAAFNHLLDK